MIVSLSATGRANPARCSSAAASPSSIDGETRGLTPPSSASSASNSAVRSSISVWPPSIAASSSPSGFSARRSCTSAPGRSAAQCSTRLLTDEIEAGVAKRHQLGIGGDPRAACPGEERDRRFGQRRPALCPAALPSGARERAVPRAEIERDGKFAVRPGRAGRAADRRSRHAGNRPAPAAARSRWARQARRSNKAVWEAIRTDRHDCAIGPPAAHVRVDARPLLRMMRKDVSG